MDAKVLLEPAFVLAVSPYANTSALLDVFSKHFGRLTLLAKGAKRKGSKLQLALQPFQLSWVGQSELKTLTAVEPLAGGCWLQGKLLYCGLYLNELIQKLLKPWDAYPDVFDLYQGALTLLSSSDADREALELMLRRFELGLLTKLGYGLSLDGLQQALQQEILDDGLYGFDEHQGLFCLSGHACEQYGGGVISGEALKALAREDLSHPRLRADIKRWMRYVIQVVLGGRTLNVRKVMAGATSQ